MRKLIVFAVIFFLSFRLVDGQDLTLPSLPGQIAYIGVDGNVYALDTNKGSPTALTSDGSLNQPYEWPTWSTDGRLAYFHAQLNDQGYTTHVFVSPDYNTPGTDLYTADGEIFTYAYWSPQNCADGANCRDLAVLLSNPVDGLFSVRLVRDAADTSHQDLIGLGAPFYYSWSPDGLRMLWQRNNERVDIFNTVTPDDIQNLSQAPGLFQSPAWSPIDDRWLFGTLAEDGQSTDLVVVSSSETRVLDSQLSGLVSFSWSPNGDYVAYTHENGQLSVVNSQTGERVVQSAVSGIYAFFWSPDSKNLAYITLATQPASISVYNSGKMAAVVQDSVGIAWSVLNVESGLTHQYSAFKPTQEMLYLLSFFDQFAQSHRVWSPDSRYLIYSEIPPTGNPIISIMDTTATDTVPFSIAQGLIGIWGF